MLGLVLHGLIVRSRAPNTDGFALDFKVLARNPALDSLTARVQAFKASIFVLGSVIGQAWPKTEGVLDLCTLSQA